MSDPQPEPPYYAVIFSSTRRAGDDGYAETGYAETAKRMVALAQQQPGFLGMESVRDAEGFGITVSYWKSEADIARWKADSEHQIAQQDGKARWYESFSLRVARVERARLWSRNG